MPSRTIPEEIIGVPLFVPSEYADYFEIESGGMPNGDDCLVIRGDLEPAATAIQDAPVLSPDIFHVGDSQAVMDDWSMSCWLYLSDLAVAGSDRVMLGCSNASAVNPFTSGALNRNIAFLLGVNGTQGAKFNRQILSTAVSPSSAIDIVGSNATCWARTSGRWHLCTFNLGPGYLGSLFIDDEATAVLTDSATGGTPNGVFNAGMRLFLGPYATIFTGRTGLWKIGKWAFHDHALSQSERELMYSTMFASGGLDFTDDFNRAAVGAKWVTGVGITAFGLDTNRAQGFSSTDRSMYWEQSVGSPNQYGEITLLPGNGVCGIISRVSRTASTWYLGQYVTSSGVFNMHRRIAGSYSAALASVTLPTTIPMTLRLETETIGSDVVLRLYEVISGTPTLRLTYTDTDASRILVGNQVGLRIVGTGSGNHMYADDFACGPL